MLFDVLPFVVVPVALVIFVRPVVLTAVAAGILVFGRRVVVRWQVGVQVEIVKQLGNSPFLFADLHLHLLPRVASHAEPATAENVPQIGNRPVRRHARAVHHPATTLTRKQTVILFF